MTKATLTVLMLLSATSGVLGQKDPFQDLKASMAGAACCRYEFLSIIESGVFETVDTTRGTALIAADGRYYIAIGPDEYLKTSDSLYSYSRAENQLVVEATAPGAEAQESVSFITRLDDYYSTSIRVPARRYFLTRTDTAAVSLPDSLTVSLTEGTPRLDRLEYFDANDDRNQIVFRKCEYLDRCDEAALTPHFPDSAEVIHLR
jgi:hypothetical protein